MKMLNAKMLTWEVKALLPKYKAMGQKNENMRESGTWKINPRGQTFID